MEKQDSIIRKHGSESTSSRVVNFDAITVYEFARTIGDNPACTEGCPIRLGDECLGTLKVDINTFERERARRLRGKELYIPVTERAAILLSTGHSLSEIVKVVMEVEDIKKSRIESLKLTQWEKLNLAMNSAGRTIRKVVRAKQQEEQDNKPNTVQARTA